MNQNNKISNQNLDQEIKLESGQDNEQIIIKNYDIPIEK